MGDLLKLALLGGAAFVAWNFFKGQTAAPASTTGATGTTPPAAPALGPLSVALANWAATNNYAASLTMSQWNYILAKLVPGSAAVMNDPTNGGTMSASDYVKYLVADKTYTTTSVISGQYGLTGVWFPQRSAAGVGANYVRPGTPMRRRF